MARRPEFYFDEKTGYYRKRVKLQSGAYKDVRAKSKEELRAKLYDLETAQRMGVILDDKTTVAQLLAQCADVNIQRAAFAGEIGVPDTVH